MDIKGVKRLVSQGEGLKIEFKRELPVQSLQDPAKDIAAFANSEGGHILIGVDDKRNIVGVDWDSEKTAQVVQEGLNCIPQIKVEVQEIDYPRAGTVATIEVQKSSWIHSDPNKRFPQRLGNRTVFMDAASLLTLAGGRGMISTEPLGLLQEPPSNPRPRINPSRIAFLFDLLSSKNHAVRVEALRNLFTLLHTFAVEDIPSIETKIFSLLDDESGAVRLEALQVIWYLWPRLKKTKREVWRSMIERKAKDIAFEDKDMNVRNTAVTLLCQAGTGNAIEIIMRLVREEPDASYSLLGLQNDLNYMSEQGMGLKLMKRLCEDLSETTKPELQARITKLIDDLRNTRWATGTK